MKVGVDPGLDGAVAMLFRDGDLQVFDMPTTGDRRGRRIDAAMLAARLREAALLEPVEVVWVENVHTHQSASASSSFRFGECCGVIRGVLSALGLPFEYVTPQVWKRALSVPADKDGARTKASQVFPQFAGLWARKKDHDRAEAALLAYFGSRAFDAR